MQYRSIHQKLSRRLGPARSRMCSTPGCTKQANEWAFVGEAEYHGVERSGQAVKWSSRIDDYAPMCRTHHRQLDGGGTWQACPHGHDRASTGVDTQGTCRACRREMNRRAAAARRVTRRAGI